MNIMYSSGENQGQALYENPTLSSVFLIFEKGALRDYLS